MVNLQEKSNVNIFSKTIVNKILAGFLIIITAMLIIELNFQRTPENIAIFTIVYLIFVTIFSLYTAFWHNKTSEYYLNEDNYVDNTFLILSFIILATMTVCLLACFYHGTAYYLYISFKSIPIISEILILIMQLLTFLSTAMVCANSIHLFKKLRREMTL